MVRCSVVSLTIVQAMRGELLGDARRRSAGRRTPTGSSGSIASSARRLGGPIGDVLAHDDRRGVLGICTHGAPASSSARGSVGRQHERERAVGGSVRSVSDDVRGHAARREPGAREHLEAEVAAVVPRRPLTR